MHEAEFYYAPAKALKFFPIQTSAPRKTRGSGSWALAGLWGSTTDSVAASGGRHTCRSWREWSFP